MAWLKAKEVKELFATQLATGKVVIIATEQTSKGIKMQVAQIRKDLKANDTTQMINLFNKQVDTERFVMSWKTVSTGMAAADAIANASEGSFLDDVLKYDERFKLVIKESDNSEDGQYADADGVIKHIEPIMNPRTGTFAESVNNKPIFRRIEIGLVSSVDVIVPVARWVEKASTEDVVKHATEDVINDPLVA